MPTRTTGPAAAVADPAAPAQDEPAQQQQQQPQPPPQHRPRTQGGRTVEEGDAFDRWLRRGLRRAFDAVVAEPVPDDLLRLIEEDRGERDRIRRGRTHDRDP